MSQTHDPIYTYPPRHNAATTPLAWPRLQRPPPGARPARRKEPRGTAPAEPAAAGTCCTASPLHGASDHATHARMTVRRKEAKEGKKKENWKGGTAAPLGSTGSCFLDYLLCREGSTTCRTAVSRGRPDRLCRRVLSLSVRCGICSVC
jgi:hypothetical protein